jgi:hypothetical protein
MPRKLNFERELRSLRSAADGELRSLTSRVSVANLRKLYRICERDNLDLSALVRKILEEQTDLYLEPGRLHSGPREAGAGVLVVEVAAEVRTLLDKVCQGLAVDLATVLRLILADSLPNWVVRAGRAQQQRRQALARLEGRLSPELAAWRVYCRLAPARLAGLLGEVGRLIDEGAVRLEVGTDGELYLELDAEASADHNAVRELVTAGVLVPERPEGAWGRWRLQPRAFSQAAEQEKPQAAEQQQPPAPSSFQGRTLRSIDDR